MLMFLAKGARQVISAQALFKHVDLTECGPVKWRDPITETGSGVYVVALADPAGGVGELPESLVARWIDGQEIVYIGRGKNLGRRLKQFYRHKHGARSPHRGGQDIILLDRPLLVYWSAVEAYVAKEKELIEAFRDAVGTIPFGNRIRAAQNRRGPVQPNGPKT